MRDWSSGEPDGVAQDCAPADPPQLSAVERVAELLEALYLREPGFTGELLDQLRRCSVADLVRLFGPPSTSAEAAPGPVAEPAGVLEPAPAVEVPAETQALQEVSQPGSEAFDPYRAECDRIRRHLQGIRHDDRGYRIGKPQSSFPRYYEPRRDSHWTR